MLISGKISQISENVTPLQRLNSYQLQKNMLHVEVKELMNEHSIKNQHFQQTKFNTIPDNSMPSNQPERHAKTDERANVANEMGIFYVETVNNKSGNRETMN